MKKQSSEKLIQVPESGLLSLVAYKLKDQVLFPKKIENAKKYLQKADLSSL